MNNKTNSQVVKKLLAKVALVTTLASTSYAGAIIDVEVGGGMWSTNEPTGTLEVSNVEFDLVKQAGLSSTSDNTYIWAVFDHAVPIVPNLRIEQVTLKSSGTKAITGGIDGLYTTSGAVDSELDLSNTDFILYWGVPFATWIPFMDEVDFGIGAKTFSGSLTMVESATGSTLVNEDLSGAFVPYAYGKLRVEPPLMLGVGLEAELKYLSVDVGSVTSDFSEVIVKADWGLTAPLPVIDIEAGFEVGYRMMSLDVDSSDLKTVVDFDGIFFGLYGKFGI